MARVSFTLKQTSSSAGSNLQGYSAYGYPSTGDNDTALRADSYVSTAGSAGVVPTTFVVSNVGTFTASPNSYSSVNLSWSVPGSLTPVASLGSTPSVTSLAVVYNPLGSPQTYIDGVLLCECLTSTDSTTHSPLPEGEWAYYSLFAQYQSTTTRPWYEKVASIEVLVPKNYGSTDDLWKRIPQTYRSQDNTTDSNVEPDAVDMFGNTVYSGQLRRALSIFGWDIDRLRTLIDYQMTAKNPLRSSTEVLDALASELGLPLTTADIGPIRLRNLISNIGVNIANKGTLYGVESALSAISGSVVEITPTRPQVLSSGQRAFTSGWSTSASVFTSASNGVLTVKNEDFFSTEGSSVLQSENGTTLNTELSVVAFNPFVAILRTPVTISQAAKYRTYFDVTPVTGASATGASVIGVMLSASPTPISSFTLDSSNAPVVYPSNFVYQQSGTVPWYQAPTDLGVIGDGSFTNMSAYLEIVLVFGSKNSSIKLANPSLIPLVNVPYNIDVYNQRTNLIKDPTFYYSPTKTSTAGSVNYWNYYVNGSTNASAYAATNSNSHMYVTVSGVTGASASINVNNNINGNLIPVRIGIPYSFSIVDKNSNIVSISLKSRAYGTIVTATSPYAQTSTADGTRRYWELLRKLEEPWLPINVSDCYIEMTLAVSTKSSVDFTKPLFEATRRNGEYFDGSFTNGGWLKGSESTGTYDYRWQDATPYSSFSFYTSDYGRTVSAIQRLAKYYVPVTEASAAGTLRFGRIIGQ